MAERIFSTDTDSGTVTVLDPVAIDKPIAVIAVGNGPRGAVQFTKLGRGYVTNSCGDTVSEIDAYSNREVAKIKVGSSPTGGGLLPGERFLLVSNSGSDDVSIVDLRNRREVARVSVGREPKHMAVTPDGRWAYIAVFGADYIAKLDLATLAQNPAQPDGVFETARIHVGNGAQPYSVGLQPSAHLAFVANNQVDYLSVIDTKVDQVINRVDVGYKGGRGVAFTPDGKNALLTLENTSELVVIDVATLKVINRMTTGPGPRGLAVNSRSYEIYIAAFDRASKTAPTPNGNTVTVLNLSATKLLSLDSAKPQVKHVRVGNGPCSVSIFDVK